MRGLRPFDKLPTPLKLRSAGRTSRGHPASPGRSPALPRRSPEAYPEERNAAGTVVSVDAVADAP